MRIRSIIAATVTAVLASTPSWADPDFNFEPTGVPEVGVVVAFVAEGEALSGYAADLDAELDGRLTSGIQRAEFTGSFGATLSLFDLGPIEHVHLVGAGDEVLDRRQLTDLGGHAAMLADHADGLSILVDSLETEIDGAASFVAMGYALGDYTYTDFKSDTEPSDSGQVTLIGSDGDAVERHHVDLAHLVAGVTLARNLGNAPGNAIYPETFVETVRAAYDGLDRVELTVLDETDLKDRGMGALLGVGQGSLNPPRLLIARYNGGARNAPPVALVGKGVTFDTGGISIKPNENMWRMKADLSGAAAVAGAVYAAASRNEEINLVGVMPLAENMPSRNAIRPGDVLTTLSGKTIEIMNTDAEGRLILSDAVTYAQQAFEPRMLLTIATLTGSAVGAVGADYSAVLTRDFDLSLEMMEIGKAAGEDVWPLPLNDRHFALLKSNIADIKNLGGTPGASTGAAVVGSFVDEEMPWVHLDMAGVFFADKARPTYPLGHAGWGVRFMDELVRTESDQAVRRDRPPTE